MAESTPITLSLDHPALLRRRLGEMLLAGIEAASLTGDRLALVQLSAELRAWLQFAPSRVLSNPAAQAVPATAKDSIEEIAREFRAREAAAPEHERRLLAHRASDPVLDELPASAGCVIVKGPPVQGQWIFNRVEGTNGPKIPSMAEARAQAAGVMNAYLRAGPADGRLVELREGEGAALVSVLDSSVLVLQSTNDGRKVDPGEEPALVLSEALAARLMDESFAWLDRVLDGLRAPRVAEERGRGPEQRIQARLNEHDRKVRHEEAELAYIDARNTLRFKFGTEAEPQGPGARAAIRSIANRVSARLTALETTHAGMADGAAFVSVDALRCPTCGGQVKWYCNGGNGGEGRADCQDGRRVSRRLPGVGEPCGWGGCKVFRSTNGAVYAISLRGGGLVGERSEE